MVDISDEIELDLRLSIGGSFRRSETLKPPVRAIDNGFDLGPRETETTPLRSNSLPTVIFKPAVDPKTKREIHALRRQEAKKKQREKRCRSSMNNSALSDSVPSHTSESQLVPLHDDDEEEQQQRAKKRERPESLGTEKNDVVSNNFPVQYPYAPVHYVPYTRGFVYPCVSVMPCRTTSFWSMPISSSGGGEPKKSFVPCVGFRPFLARKNGEVVAKTTPGHGSPVCSSSTVSDHQSRSSSQEGDGISDARTHNSSQSSPEQSQQDGYPKPKDCQNNKHKFEAQSVCNSHNQTAPAQKSSTKTKSNSVTGKPPRPQCHNIKSNDMTVKIAPQAALFPEMPYVSTRGSGPDGRTVTGLLYRYNKSEVSIVCVCHGSTFSPAEFVQHAGGTAISHPLRHITVI